jgi:hypothetical protein
MVANQWYPSGIIRHFRKHFNSVRFGLMKVQECSGIVLNKGMFLLVSFRSLHFSPII